MGKGKGAPEQWVCVIRPGKILFEMEGVTWRIAQGSDAAGRGEDRDADQVGHARRNGREAEEHMKENAEKARAPGRGRARQAVARRRRADVPAALPVVDGADGRGQETSRAAQGAGADADGAARARRAAARRRPKPAECRRRPLAKPRPLAKAVGEKGGSAKKSGGSESDGQEAAARKSQPRDKTRRHNSRWRKLRLTIRTKKSGSVVSTKMAKTIVVEVIAARAASAVQANRQQAQKVLRARRKGRGQGGRCGAHHRVPPDEQAEALAVGAK